MEIAFFIHDKISIHDNMNRYLLVKQILDSQLSLPA